MCLSNLFSVSLLLAVTLLIQISELHPAEEPRWCQPTKHPDTPALMPNLQRYYIGNAKGSLAYDTIERNRCRLIHGTEVVIANKCNKGRCEFSETPFKEKMYVKETDLNRWKDKECPSAK